MPSAFDLLASDDEQVKRLLSQFEAAPAASGTNDSLLAARKKMAEILDATLRAFTKTPAGPWLLVLVALGPGHLRQLLARRGALAPAVGRAGAGGYGPWPMPMVLLSGALQAAPARDTPTSALWGVTVRQLTEGWLVPMKTADTMRATASDRNSTARPGTRLR